MCTLGQETPSYTFSYTLQESFTLMINRFVVNKVSQVINFTLSMLISHWLRQVCYFVVIDIFVCSQYKLHFIQTLDESRSTIKVRTCVLFQA